MIGGVRLADHTRHRRVVYARRRRPAAGNGKQRGWVVGQVIRCFREKKVMTLKTARHGCRSETGLAAGTSITDRVSDRVRRLAGGSMKPLQEPDPVGL